LPSGATGAPDAATAPRLVRRGAGGASFARSATRKQQEERAEQKYKNIQLLKGIPSDRLTKIMFAFKGSLGLIAPTAT